MKFQSWTALNINKVLAVRLDSLGDVLMTGPALRSIKEGLPSSQLTLLTSPAGAEAARLLPGVDDVIVYEAPWMKHPKCRDSDWDIVSEIRSRGFDAAIIFTVYSQNPLPAALLLTWAGVPHRLGHCRENPYQLLSHWVPDPEPEQLSRHEVRRQLDLVAHVGFVPREDSLRIDIDAASEARIQKAATESGIDAARPWIVVHPGASASSRRYPIKHYGQVLQRLLENPGFEVIVTGSQSEQDLEKTLKTVVGERFKSFVGRLSLSEFAALIKLSTLVISNNTSAVHLAAATQTPVVDLYALTNPQHTPWRVPHRLLFHDVDCKYCYKSTCPRGDNACLSKVSPQVVIEAAWDLLKERKPK